jgi:hypothetical protein
MNKGDVGTGSKARGASDRSGQKTFRGNRETCGLQFAENKLVRTRM